MVRGIASFKIAHKLKILKAEIRNWTKVTGKQEEKDISGIIDEIANMDSLEAKNHLSPQDRDERSNLKIDLAHKLHLEAI